MRNIILTENAMELDVPQGENYLLVYGRNGDVTGDNQVKMQDLMKILHHVSGRKNLYL